MTITELMDQTRDDLIAIDDALIALAVMEHRATGNTVRADKATKALNRIAVRFGLADVGAQS
jgi:phosphoglycolate phosphatase-like HAD superfamily hydrolase